MVVLFGTRPEAIKLAPVILALRDSGFDVKVVTTGQHRELASDVLPLFGIAVSHDIALMRTGQSLDYVLGTGIECVGKYLDQLQPAAVVVQGDTTSTLASALAAFHRHVPVAHVEAGLRTHNIALPFPEEMNRRVVSVLATWHFAPTQRAAENLAREGVAERIFVTGNTVVDAVHHILRTPPHVPGHLVEFTSGRRYVVATAHRRESWGDGIRRVAQGLARIVDESGDLHAIFVCHPNPLARQPVLDVLDDHPRVRIVDAVRYSEFLALLRDAAIVISDSGGIQEEAPTLGVPVIVTRAVTERPEGVDAGVVRLAGTDSDEIVRHARDLLQDPNARARTAEAARQLYGDGQAAKRIASTLAQAFSS